ncbi:MAG: serine/threonine protein kinase [Polyangiaceae bacterium]|nr:serine/threonine protein kinase [Polyangiaceae bacterium]
MAAQRPATPVPRPASPVPRPASPEPWPASPEPWPASPASPEPPAASTRGKYKAGDVLTHRYRLIEPIGQGGMGSVWRAKSLGLDLDVALKLIRSDTEVPHAGERLLKEARAAARVVHPAAVRVFDYSVTEAGDPFLVMELLTGASLATRIASLGPMPAAPAVQLLLPVIGALAVAHREGIVHRDVKPANIMLVEDAGRLIPKLIDFGIAGVAATAWSKKLTAHGMLLGSPIYMAPEQVRGGGGDPDERTDIWGICTVLYELVSGARPFGGPSSAAVVLDILYARLPRPELLTADKKLWSIVERGLSKAPEDRWPTMTALGQALASWAIANGVEYDVMGASLAAHWRERPLR